MAKLNLLLRAVLVACAWLPAGCADQPVKVPDQVKVEVSSACIPPEKRPTKPAVRSEAELWAMDEYHRTIAVWSDLTALRDIYLPQAEAVIEGCSRLPAALPLERGAP